MKKIFILIFILAFVFPLMAQDEGDYEEEDGKEQPVERQPVFRVSGVAKSGVLWSEAQDEGREKEYSKTEIRNNDGDSGNQQGRFRVDMDYDNGKNLGFRARIDWETWNGTEPDKWGYAFGYGNFFKDQLTISVGKLGGSPWGTGGPEMWRELESLGQGGIRVEWKPAFIPKKAGEFNIGFVLNSFDQPAEASSGRKDATLLHILGESVLGISYTHKYAHARFAFRLDSDWDNKLRKYEDEGGKLVYRVEERIIQKYLPGFQIWALGYFDGIGAKAEKEEDMKEYLDFRNWFFIQYDHKWCTAQIRLGYDWVDKRSIFYAKPSLYWKFLNNLINVGASFTIAQDFGDRINPDAPFQYIQVEPKLQLNFTSSYFAFVYNYKRAYKEDYPEARGKDPIRQEQFINLRFCLYF